ncbi:BREX-1 system adenine-specific DNA-methyltransferase PglX [Psychrobacter sp. BF1]|uniref:BREX-1 system adenine-specific DNA-methyltransferase PglX n=1 Tax=Psychrobacter sp. BF1 TaxID=2821147 RepID=UPI001C4E26C8|nr:BREX-1 system adenine-specific DNA-methyltransferase PglX [Psychrobacter sp. BF1]
MAFDQTTRNRLQSFVSKARAILSEEFTRQLQATYGLDPNQGTIADIESLSHLDNYQLQTAHILRDTLQHYMTTTAGKTQKEQVKLVLERIVREQAFTVLNRLAALRMAEARGFLLESIGSGYSSQGFQLYQMLEDGSHGETGDAYQSYLFSLFDEFGLDLAVLFDRFSVQGRLFPRETALLQLIEQINDYEIEPLWAEDETIGWIYQFWNGRDEIDKMRSASRAPRTSREMAVRNQFFTPRYVVEFLTDNTLGLIWYEMTKGNTTLVDSCQYLVKRPNEVFLVKDEISPIQYESNLNNEADALTQEEILSQPVYIQHRPLKDPRTIRMLDPACGSMHFGLYAFDLFERIYIEAWQIEVEQGADVFEREMELQSLQSSYGDLDSFKQQIPKLIIEHNIHGVDIDPRAVQIAGLSLWQRAQRAWHEQGIKPQQRPVIVKSNIVCAEPMPGEQDLLKEFTSTLNPPALGQLVEVIFDKMSLAGEAGTLLKIEQEIQSAIDEARNQWQDKKASNRIGDLFEEELLEATPQQELGFDLSGINDETFWEDAEQLILQALKGYSEQATSAAGEKRLFAEDAAKGFAFIDLSRKKFDVILMNPPFGSSTSKLDHYIKQAYADHSHDVINNFIERAMILGTSNRFCGVILSRTLILNERITDFRVNTLLKKNTLSYLIDLGGGVLDAAVDTALLVFKENQLKDSTLCADILREEPENKEAVLKEFCNLSYKRTYIVKSKDFSLIPMGVLCYWAEPWLLNLFTRTSLEKNYGTVRKGLITGDDERFARNTWEVQKCSWNPLFKGGVFSTFYAPLDMSINWLNDGRELRAFAIGKYGSESRTLKNIQYIGRKSLGWSIKNSVGFGVRIIEDENVVYNDNGPGFFPEQSAFDTLEVYSLLALFNSSLFKLLLRVFQVGERGRYQWLSAHVTLLPAPDIFDRKLEELGKAITDEFKKIFSFFEEFDVFKPESFEELVIEVGENKEFSLELFDMAISNIKNLYTELDQVVLRCYGVESIVFNKLSSKILDERERPENNYKKIAESLASSWKSRVYSYYMGTNFGRWCLKEENEIISLNQLTNLISNNNHSILLNPDVYEDSIKEYLSKPMGFFDNHLKLYSRNKRFAPIYWPLQTVSGSYTLWVYYHRLNSQTLYSCINDFVEPRLTLVTEDLNALSNNSNRSSTEEKELTKLTDFQSELKDFRDELLRLAKIWKPNLNDGVQITAAPLWKLFQHTAWQKKLKETWEKLEEGEYDWAHLAASMWPERVLRKCHQDRSLAIAHDVEDMFWQEVEVPIMRGKKPTGKTKLEWQPIPASETMLNDMVNEAKARLQ